MEDIATKVEGSILSPEEFNQIPEELENAITSSGQTLTKQDTTQLRKAMAAYAGAGAGFSVTGSANNLVLTPYDNFQAPIRYYPNQIINFIPSSPNTSSVTISIVGLTSVNLLDGTGQALEANKLVPNNPYMAIFNGTNFQLIETGASLDGSNITLDFSKNVIRDYVSNAVIGYSGEGITYYNNVFTVLGGYQTLIPIGRTETNTLKNYNLYVAEDSNFTGPTATGDYVLLIKQDGTLIWVSSDNYSEEAEDKDVTSSVIEYYYNLTTNKTYYHDIEATEWVELPFAKAGDFTVADGTISKLVVKEPVRLDRGGDSNGQAKASFNLFDFKWSDHLQEDASWLRADTFSWQSGKIYKSAYNELLDQLTKAESTTTETVEGISITYYKTPKKYKIVDASQEAAVSSIYSATGIAWYYIVDTVNRRFKLPRVDKNISNIFSMPVAGNGKAIGLTDGTTNSGLTWGTIGAGNTIQGSTAAFDADLGATSSPTSGYTANKAWGVTTDATKSGMIVDIKNAKENHNTYLYFYVGNTIRNQTEVDVGEITEALNNKADNSRFQVVETLPETLSDNVFYFLVE